MADKFDPNNNILSFSEYMKELEEQKKSLAKSKNDESFNNMVCEFAVRTNANIGRLITIVEEQQKTIRSMAKEIENLKRKKGGTNID